MGWHLARKIRGSALLFAAFTASCGPTAEPHSVTQPKLETVAPAPTAEGWGTDVAPGFLRPCTTLSAGNGLVELACDDYQVVEFRRPPVSPEPGNEVPAPEGLDALMDILAARFGPLLEQRGQASIDRQRIETSSFSSEKYSDRGEGPNGLAVVVANAQGQFWGLACYRKDGPADRAYCSDAIASAARSGGLAHVGAHPIKGLGDGRLVTPANCESIPGRKIHCAGGELSWSVGDERDALELREETLQSLRDMANKEKVVFESEARACTLFGTPADCLMVTLNNPTKKEQLHFVLLTGGEQERLVVCTTPNDVAETLPEPCDQAITLSPVP